MIDIMGVLFGTWMAHVVGLPIRWLWLSLATNAAGIGALKLMGSL